MTDLGITQARGVRTLLLNRPSVRNAFHGGLLLELTAALADAEADASARVIVIAGAGPMFCAGADLGWMAAAALEGDEANDRNARAMGSVFHALADCRKPTVARVHGAALGGGVGLLAACDVVVAGPAASFALSEVRLGLVPAVISPFVVRRLGPARARVAFLRGGRLDAAEGYRQGLCDVLAAEPGDDALDAAVAVVVDDLRRGGPEALLVCKTLVDGVAGRPPAEVLDFTARLIAERRASAEAQEGMAAFLGKRPAAWIGDSEGP